MNASPTTGTPLDMGKTCGLVFLWIALLRRLVQWAQGSQVLTTSWKMKNVIIYQVNIALLFYCLPDKVSLDTQPFSSSLIPVQNASIPKASSLNSFNRPTNNTDNLSPSFHCTCKYCNSQKTEFLGSNINSIYVVTVSKIMINCLVL